VLLPAVLHSLQASEQRQVVQTILVASDH